ncbi:MAG: hypothetical protein U5O16_14005 [Rhodococcus sp. (in: high G+C Gram-positive bacteria)]|nr:hypothetical protein [Rhodococcus sp. (in: high G+C Gram-positive bacteria)]
MTKPTQQHPHTTHHTQPAALHLHTHSVTVELGTGKGYTLKTLPTTTTP